MKKENMNYDEIYQETASKLLLATRQLRSELDTALSRMSKTLQVSFRHQLTDELNVPEDKPGVLRFKLTNSPDYGAIEVAFKYIFTLEDVYFINEDCTFYTRENSRPSTEEVIEYLKERKVLPQAFSCESLRQMLANIRFLADRYEEASHKYMDLECSHLVQFTHYLQCRIQQERIFKYGKQYILLGTLDSFCSADEEDFFSGLTIVLIRSDWKCLRIPGEFHYQVRQMLEDGTEESKRYIRNNLNEIAFLSCKVGSYYPLTFEQLWEQMCIGMNLDNHDNPQ